jgi:hypothetical protein
MTPTSEENNPGTQKLDLKSIVADSDFADHDKAVRYVASYIERLESLLESIATYTLNVRIAKEA